MENSNIIRIGVVGVGHLGNFHLKQLNTITGIIISGVYDNNLIRAGEISKKYNIKSYSSLENLLKNSDAITIVTPTNTHYHVADIALEYNCHIFIEKPITDNIQTAKKLINKAKKLNKIIQVGHIERFNPAFDYIKTLKLEPQFIESHRLAKFNPRGNDVPVMLDLMIHDLDIILSLIHSDIKEIRASGVKVVSSTFDMANARIEFNNGCIANLTASRISQKNMRKMRLFQEKDYITIDFQKSFVEEYQVNDIMPNHNPEDLIFEVEGENKKYIKYQKPQIHKYDALKEELKHFIYSINNVVKPETDGESATKALDIALQIQKIIDQE